MSDQRPPSNWVPVLVLAAIVALMAGGWWLFPRWQASMARADCEAAGHTNCR